MKGAVTVHMDAPAEEIWDLISDVRNTGRFSPETLEAEWVGGATGPAVGVKFRGHVKRNGRGPMYWTVCRVTHCEPGREFGFVVLGPGGREINHWHYRLEPTSGGGTDVTESFRLEENPLLKLYWTIAGRARGKTNERGMRETLERVKAVAEQDDGGAGQTAPN